MDCIESCKPVSSTILRMIVDSICLILVYIPSKIVRSLLTSRGAFFRGFYCDDESIRYPYHDDTVSITAVKIGGIGIPGTIILVTELFRYFCRDRSLARHLSRYRITNTFSIPILFAALYHFFGLFLFGFAAVSSVTDIAKIVIGRPRPHFLDVCQPNLALLNCTAESHNYVYIDKYTCTGTDLEKSAEARVSFPSGHSSLSWYSAIFVACYLQSRFKWTGSRLARPLIQTTLVSLALFVCLSRISDYKHHWSDVLSGSLLGITFALVGGLYISGLFKYREEVRPGGYGASPADETQGYGVSNGDDTRPPETFKITEFEEVQKTPHPA